MGKTLKEMKKTLLLLLLLLLPVNGVCGADSTLKISPDLAFMKNELEHSLDEIAKKHPWAAGLMSEKELKIRIKPKTKSGYADPYLITGQSLKKTIDIYVPVIYTKGDLNNDSLYSILYPRLEITFLHELVHYEQYKLITGKDIQSFETSEEKMIMMMFQEYDAFFKSDTISSDKYKDGATTKFFDDLFKDFYSNQLDMFAELLPRDVYENFCKPRKDSVNSRVSLKVSMCYSGKKEFDEEGYKVWFEAKFPDCKDELLPKCFTKSASRTL